MTLPCKWQRRIWGREKICRSQAPLKRHLFMDVFSNYFATTVLRNQTLLSDTGTGDDKRLLVNVQAFVKDLGDDINLGLAAYTHLLVAIRSVLLWEEGKWSHSHSSKNIPSFFQRCSRIISWHWRQSISVKILQSSRLMFGSKLGDMNSLRYETFIERLQGRARRGTDKLQRCWH